MPQYSNAQYLQEVANGERKDNGAQKLKELSPIHEEMIAMHLDGARNKDVAQYFNVTDANVSLVLSDPLAKAVIAEARQQNQARFANLYGKVVDVIEDAVAPNESIDVRLKGATLYMREGKDAGSQEKETAEDVISKIINMQINGDIIVQGG